MELYEDSGYCFSCNYRDYSVGDKDAARPEPDNVLERLEVIRERSEIREIRGLQLLADQTGFHIIWPDDSFFKTRSWSGNPRYLAPRGHQAPLFIYPVENPTALVLVEGELNAMSLKFSIGNQSFAIASPGSAGEFLKHLEEYLTFPIVVAIVDHDPAGVAAGITLKKELLKRGKRIHLAAVKEDFNQVLQDKGPEGVKLAFYQTLGLPVRMPGNEDPV
jgi:hypothetical protein